MSRRTLLRLLPPAGMLLLGACAAAPPPDPYAEGKAWLMQDKLGLALQSFRLAARTEGHSVRVLNALGAVHDAMGRPEVADGYYREALAVEPGDAQTLNNLGYSLLLRHRASDAEDVLAQAAAASPKDTLIAHNLELAQAQAQAQAEPPPARPAAAPAAEPRVPDGPPQRLGPWLERSARAVMTLRTDLAAWNRAAALDADPVVALPPPPAPTKPPPAQAACPVVLANGNGRAGDAAHWRTLLAPKGVDVTGLANAASFAFDRTEIRFPPACAATVAKLAAMLPAPPVLRPSDGAGVRVVIGRDLLPFDRKTEVET